MAAATLEGIGFTPSRSVDFAARSRSAGEDRPQRRRHMKRIGAVLKLAGAAWLFSLALAAHGQASNEKPIRFVLPFGSGTSTDQLARLMAEVIASESKQSVVVENKPGAEGFIGAQAVATAPADGSVVLISSNSTHSLNPNLYRKLPYDAVKDFIPVRT
ncbi:MAG: Bug family tripartite tricarboxylate transporter substrate binding protein, partial [Lautropia sp.]